ncbi:hypothetical protein SDC9_186088 [bioreactor metagenome]|uniref:Uncharacterized protein n=1 Tax=bioreactor metagenome TaxID=1076179 RepID=A0A645HQZ9_9ZZZZ
MLHHRDVAGGTGDHGGRAELADVFDGKLLHFVEDGFPQHPGRAGRKVGAEITVPERKQCPDARGGQHKATRNHDCGDILPDNAVVDYFRHKIWRRQDAESFRQRGEKNQQDHHFPALQE